MKRAIHVIALLSLTLKCISQRSIKKYKLAPELHELSGLEKFNDSTLVAINDGGNTPELFFLDLNGIILKTTVVSNAFNTDWEDLAKDTRGYLYISDAGNNDCSRTELCIWKVNLEHAYSRDTVSAEVIRFSYQEQVAPKNKGCRFDSEAIFWYNDTLHILSKDVTRPRKNHWENGTSVYKISDQSGFYHVKSSAHLWTGGDNRLKHQVTGAHLMGNQLSILTYGKVFFYFFNGTSYSLLETRIIFPFLKQREAIVILDDQTILVGSERHPLLGGAYLHTFKWK